MPTTQQLEDQLAILLGGAMDSPRDQPRENPLMLELQKALADAIREKVNDSVVGEPKERRRFQFEMGLKQQERQNQLSDADTEFGRRKDLMKYEHELNPREDPASMLRNEVTKMELEQTGDPAAALAVASGKQAMGGARSMVAAAGPRWEQREKQIWDQYESDPAAKLNPGWLTDQYDKLMQDVRAQHPGEDGERMARSFGETLNRHLYDVARRSPKGPRGVASQKGSAADIERAGAGPAGLGPLIKRNKERQFGVGQAGVGGRYYDGQ